MNISLSDPRLAAFLQGGARIAATQDFTQDRRHTTLLLSYIATAIACLFLILRFWARFRQNIGYGLDDWLILLSFAFMSGNLGCVIVLIQNGVGLHSGALSLAEIMKVGKVLVGNEVIYVTNINIIKLSVLVMYYRFFPIRPVRIGGLALGLLSCAWNISLSVLAVAQCVPFKKTYAPWVEGDCINLKATFLAIALPNILTDLAILTLPLPHVWKLQTNIPQKISLTAIFLLGSFVVFASIYRFIIFVRYEPNDLPYSIAPGLAWNTIEISSGIVSASLPTFGPFIRKYAKKVVKIPLVIGSSTRDSKISPNSKNEKLDKGSGVSKSEMLSSGI
ncbi:hypothetical protein K3495_g6144 [Podosphaera aphanis]|nr:hypothetical protein K3495_g6144 [Podosphaera aphanis]